MKSVYFNQSFRHFIQISCQGVIKLYTKERWSKSKPFMNNETCKGRRKATKLEIRTGMKNKWRTNWKRRGVQRWEDTRSLCSGEYSSILSWYSLIAKEASWSLFFLLFFFFLKGIDPYLLYSPVLTLSKRMIKLKKMHLFTCKSLFANANLKMLKITRISKVFLVCCYSAFLSSCHFPVYKQLKTKVSLWTPFKLEVHV